MGSVCSDFLGCYKNCVTVCSPHSHRLDSCPQSNSSSWANLLRVRDIHRPIHTTHNPHVCRTELIMLGPNTNNTALTCGRHDSD